MTYLKNLQYIKTWLALGLLWVAIVFTVSLYPSPPDLSSLTFADKIVHSLSYFFLMFWFLQIVKEKAQTLTALLLISMGVIIEILQGLSGYRTFDYYDMLANTFGVLVAWPLKRAGIAHMISKLESRMLKTAAHRINE